MKLLLLSDLQGVTYDDWIRFLNYDMSGVDAIFLLGDVDIRYLQDIENNFSDIPTYGVHGNHDFHGDLEYYSVENVHMKKKQVGDFSLAGFEGSIRYKNGSDPMFTEKEAANLLEQLSPTDILITHNSPKGIHDKNDRAHQGFESLLTYLLKNKPIFHFHGHQHVNTASYVGETLVVGIYGVVLFDTTTRQLHQLVKIDE